MSGAYAEGKFEGIYVSIDESAQQGTSSSSAKVHATAYQSPISIFLKQFLTGHRRAIIIQ